MCVENPTCFGHIQGDIQQSKIHYWLVIAQMCNNPIKTQRTGMVNKI